MPNERSGYIDQWHGLSVLAAVIFHVNPERLLFGNRHSNSNRSFAGVLHRKIGTSGGGHGLRHFRFSNYATVAAPEAQRNAATGMSDPTCNKLQACGCCDRT